ncbi:MAG TPA: biotin carboxylase N-terminal domain-containing protein [Acidimicrobiales bacterium]|nr:biotin carboxylase N-terminal domain-containing protein [Acidimicrobiales bacterium]
MTATMPRIRKLLIANRGEIACRIARTAHRMGIATVGVYSDADAGAPHTLAVGEAVHLPGSTPADTYLRADLLVDAGRRTGAQAVHPGYGFLSENAGFARACGQAGLIFVGPPPDAIDAMASKIEAKQLMADAGVPVLPGLTIDTSTHPAVLAEGAERVGYPVMVKAAFGGGGRGMRIVRRPEDLSEAVEEARREAASAFGNGAVFLERYVQDPRHIEVQVFADGHGNVVHLFERECSIQRRHQKIIEESPSPAVGEEQRDKLGSTAVAAARAIGYVGAGTVEFVMDRAGEFYFLEVNTRLQVEHPVTEMITGLDLVQLQLDVAAGLALPEEAMAATVRGHAIEARLYAEDVPGGFLPASGILSRFEIPAGPGIRVDSGYVNGSSVSTFYDAMLAKVIAWAPTRPEAADRLASALREASLHGVVTNRPLLARILESDDFQAGRTDTGFLERHHPAELGAPLYRPEAPRLHAHAAAAHRILSGAWQRPTPPGVPPGWRNVGGGTAPIRFRVDGVEVDVPGRVQEFDGISVVDADGGSVLLDHGGIRRAYRIHRDGLTWYVDSGLGSTVLDEVDRFPPPDSAVAEGSLVAPMPGLVTSVRVAVGDRVDNGQVVVTVEAMKMEHSVRAPQPGLVREVKVGPGDQVENGAVLVVVDEQAEG